MKSAIIVVLLLAVFWFFPQVSEGAGDPCGALAIHVTTLAARPGLDKASPAAAGLARFAGSAVAMEAMRQRYPSVPPQLSCAFFYWRVLISPDDAARLLGQ